MLKEELDKKCYIDKVYSFENFITNESNIEIFELLKNYPNMNMKYNPIVIEGNFGTGKTHLLNAFKNEHSDKYNIKIEVISQNNQNIFSYRFLLKMFSSFGLKFLVLSKYKK